MIKSLLGFAWCFFVHLVWNAVTLLQCVSQFLFGVEIFFSYSIVNYCIIFVWSSFFFTHSNYLHVGFPDFLLDIHHAISCCFAFFFSFDVWDSVIYPLYHWLQYHLLRAAISFSFLTIFPDHNLLSFHLILLPLNVMLLFMIPNSSFINAMPSSNLLQMPCIFPEIFLFPFINFQRYFLLLNLINRPWFWERLRAGGEGDDRGWGGWMASLTRWTWVWVDSRSWWWTGRPGVLRFMGLQRVRHDWTELNWIALFLSSVVEFYFKTASKIVYNTQISYLPLDIVSGLSWIFSSSVTGILLSATSQG